MAKSIISDFRVMMAMFAALIFVIGWISMYASGEFSLGSGLTHLVFTGVLIGTIASADKLIFPTADAIQRYVKSDGKLVEKYLDSMGEMQVEGETSWDFMIPGVVGILVPFTRFALFAVFEGVRILQAILLQLCFAISPLMLSFLSLKVTREAGIKFIMATFSFMLWPIGFVFAELSFIVLLKAMGEALFEVTSTKGFMNAMASDVGLSVYLACGVLVCTVFLMAMYVIAPLLITYIIQGANPGQLLAMGAQAAVAGATGGASAIVAGRGMAAGGISRASGAAGAVGKGASAVGGTLQSAGEAISNSGGGKMARAAKATAGAAMRGMGDYASSVGGKAQFAGKVGNLASSAVGYGTTQAPKMGFPKKMVKKGK